LPLSLPLIFVKKRAEPLYGSAPNLFCFSNYFFNNLAISYNFISSSLLGTITILCDTGFVFSSTNIKVIKPLTNGSSTLPALITSM